LTNIYIADAKIAKNNNGEGFFVKTTTVASAFVSVVLGDLGVLAVQIAVVVLGVSAVWF